MKKAFIFCCLLAAGCSAISQTPVQFPIRDLTGSDLGRLITVTPLDPPVVYNSTLYNGGPFELQPVPYGATNGLGQRVNGAWTNLIGGNFRITFQGLPLAAQIYVPFGFTNGISAADPAYARKGIVQVFVITNIFRQLVIPGANMVGVTNGPVLTISLSGPLLSSNSVTAIGDGRYIAMAAGRGTNTALLNPSLTNGVNFGSAFSSIGSGTQSEEFGVGALASGTTSYAAGPFSLALGLNASAVGPNAGALSDTTSAYGAGAQAEATNSSALGSYADAKHINSTAVGYLATTTRPNQIMLGTSSQEVNIPGQASVAGVTNLAATPNTAAIHDINGKIISLANGGANTVLHGTAPPTETSVVEADFGFTDITTANASTSAHGLLPKGDNSAAHFLSGQLGFVGLTLAGAQFANQGTTTTILHGNASGNPSWAAVDISSAEITGTLKAAAFPALTGDVTTSAGSLTTTLKNTGTAGTYTKPTFNAQGLETSGASAQLASSDFANQGTTTTLLHGNAAGNPSWAAVDVSSAEITGTLKVSALPTQLQTLTTNLAPATLTNIIELTSATIPIGAWSSNNVADGASITAASFESPTNSGDAYAFAHTNGTSAVTNCIISKFALPWDWDGGVVRLGLEAYCSGTNASAGGPTNTVWSIDAGAIGNGDRLDLVSYGTAVWTTNGISTNKFIPHTAITTDLTVGNSPNATNSIVWRIKRLGGQAGDTLTNFSLYLSEVRVYYKRKTRIDFPNATP